MGLDVFYDNFNIVQKSNSWKNMERHPRMVTLNLNQFEVDR